MTNLISSLVLLLVLAFASFGQGGGGAETTYIVTLRAKDSVMAAKAVRSYATFPVYFVPMTDAEAFALKQFNPNVVSVERVGRSIPIIVADEVQTGVTSWGLDRVDQRSAALDATYTYNQTGIGVDVFIMDTGINFTHDEFGGRAKPFYDGVGDGQNGNDCNGHGTHLAGIVGGATFGVAKQVTLYSARIFNCDGYGLDIGNVLNVIDRVNTTRGKGRKYRPAVVNMSWIFAGQSPALETAINASIAQGVVYVAAAGNQAYDACNVGPAYMPQVITVGAMANSNGFEERARYSDFGPCVDLFAPGDLIYSAGIGSNTATREYSGTSQATPFVAGAAALYLQAHPSATVAEVANALRANATPNILANVGEGSPNLLLYTRFQ
jgi:aqualysin 1